MLAGFGAVWLFAAASPIAGALLATRLPEPGQRPAPTPWRSLFPRTAVRPGVALGLAVVGYAAFAGFLVLHLAARGVGNGFAVFSAFASAVVVARIAAGRIPDRFGPRRSAAVSACFETIGLVVVALASALGVAIAGAVLAGVGFSLLFPSLGLMVVNEVSEEERGAALGTFTAFFDVGAGLGGLLTGSAAAVAGYPAAFWTAAACAAGALVTALLARRTQRSGRTAAL